jgi:hypothetical protein
MLWRTQEWREMYATIAVPLPVAERKESAMTGEATMVSMGTSFDKLDAFREKVTRVVWRSAWWQMTARSRGLAKGAGVRCYKSIGNQI